jgi:hypothetical protein
MDAFYKRDVTTEEVMSAYKMLGERGDEMDNMVICAENTGLYDPIKLTDNIWLDIGCMYLYEKLLIDNNFTCVLLCAKEALLRDYTTVQRVVIPIGVEDAINTHMESAFEQLSEWDKANEKVLVACSWTLLDRASAIAVGYTMMSTKTSVCDLLFRINDENENQKIFYKLDTVNMLTVFNSILFSQSESEGDDEQKKVDTKLSMIKKWRNN